MWRFSDGTEVDPGGDVRGASLFAQRLRRGLGTDLLGRGPRLSLAAAHEETTPLDPDHSGMLDQWLRTQLESENRIHGHPVRMVERHSPLMPLPPAPWEPGDLVEGRVY